jgi:pSer/pThr/pTyr-binding forkhead associated (FHA) protein
MWILESDESVQDRVVFRMPIGSVRTIGRSTGAEFMVDAPLVSRLHCQLSSTTETLVVKDLDSTNGTYVNGQRITSTTLQPGDRLSIGRAQLRISRTD